MGDTSKMSHEKMDEALEAIVAAEAACLEEFAAAVPRRMNAAQKERSAYLRGRLAGLHQAHREFEKRAPIEFYGSGFVDGQPRQPGLKERVEKGKLHNG